MAFDNGRGPVPHFSSLNTNLDPTNGFTAGTSVNINRHTPDGRWIPDVLQGQQLNFGIDRSRNISDERSLEKRVNKVLPDTFTADAAIFLEELLILNVLTSQERLLDWAPIIKNPHGVAVRYRRTIFHHVLPDPIPEQGVARVVTQSYESWEAYSSRVGLAFQMEDGFKMTEKGQRDYVCHLAQLTNSFVTYGLLDIIMAFLTQAKPWMDEVITYRLQYSDGEFRQRCAKECELYGIVSKTPNPGNEIYFRAREIGNSRGREFTDMIVPGGTKFLFTSKDTYNQNYNNVGPRAYDFQDGRRNQLDRVRFNEYETARYPIGRDGKWTDPLLRQSVTAAYHDFLQVDYSNPEKYRSMHDCLLLVDHKTDEGFKVSLTDCLRYSGLFMENGNITQDGVQFFTRAAPNRPFPAGRQIRTLGDYLKYQGLFTVVVKATTLALKRIKEARDTAAYDEFRRLYPVVNQPDALNAAAHDHRSVDDKIVDARAAIEQLAADNPASIYHPLLGVIRSFASNAFDPATQIRQFDTLTAGQTDLDPAVLEFFEALSTRLQPPRGSAASEKYKAACHMRNRLRGVTGSPVEFDENTVAKCFEKLPIQRDGQGLTMKHFAWFIAHDVQVPIRFAAVRFSHDIMGTFIVGIAGGQTANLCLGDGNFQLSHNGSQKMLYGFAHIYIGVVVHNRENVALLPNVRAVQHVCGGSNKFWDPFRDREAYRRGTFSEPNDIFVIPRQPCEILPDNLDLSGVNPPQITSAKPFDYVFRPNFTSMWNITQPVAPLSDKKYFAKQTMPTRVFRGGTFYSDPSKSMISMAFYVKGTGHWPEVYPGCTRVRNGAGDSLLLQRPANVVELPAVVSYDYPMQQF